MPFLLTAGVSNTPADFEKKSLQVSTVKIKNKNKKLPKKYIKTLDVLIFGWLKLVCSLERTFVL